MMNSAAILVVVLILSVNYHSNETPAKHNQAGNGQAQANAVAPVVPQPPSASHPQTEANEYARANEQDSVTIINAPATRNKRDWLDYATLAAGLILAIITGYGVLAAWRGLPEFKKQADAAKESAEAARLNAQAVINAERSWIVIEVERESKTTFHFRARNTGRTAANVTAIYGHPLLVRRNREIPTPDFTKRESLLSTPPGLLPANATCSVLRYDIVDLRKNDSVEDFLKYVGNGLFEIWFYGRVLYFNTVDPEPRTERETLWFFWYVPFEDALPIPDPLHPEYNTYT